MSEQPLFIGPLTIDEAIFIHLQTCTQCGEASARDRKVGLGQHSSHCGIYWQMMLDRANYEGKINNIVAHTEYGDEAPIIGRLE